MSYSHAAAFLVFVATCSTLAFFGNLPPSFAATAQTELKAKILLRALAYDRNITERAAGVVAIAIVYDPNKATSRAQRDEMSAAFSDLAKLTFQDMPMRVFDLPYTSAAALASVINERGVDVLYVCPGLESAIADITSTTRRLKVASVTADTPYADAGVSIEVRVEGNTPKLRVNLQASKDEGMSLAAELMQIAEVVR